MSARRAPRPLSVAVGELERDLAPATTLARVQMLWEGALGRQLAEAARPTAERQGRLTVTCSASVWAQELELMAPQLLERINSALGSQDLIELRCRTA